MGKRNQKWTEEKIAKLLKEGRGSGELSGYIPWLKNQDFPSKGRTHRLKGWKTQREHQLFSDIERNYFYILDWAKNVIDIREQYPLDREKTLQIADKKEIAHSIDISSKTPIVMTTDFLITVKKIDGFEFIARSIKPASELNDKRVIEKLEVERQYWKDEKVDWGIVTEKDIPTSLWRNIELIHHNYYISETDSIISENLFYFLEQSKGILINSLNSFDFRFNLDRGSALALFKYLLAKRVIKLDMTQNIDFRMDISNLIFTGFEAGERGERIESLYK